MIHADDNPRAAPAGADPLAALRRATATRHQQLDSGLAIAGEAPALADYAAHLRMLRAWLGPLEVWLDGFDDGPQALASLAPAGRLALIDADLAEPGMGAHRETDASAWPAAASPAWRWGVCYVVEGSQLGGAMLYQRLAAPLAPHPLRYLRGDEAGPGPRWRAFMVALREHVRTPDEIADACAGACAAFDRILEGAALPGREAP